MPIFKHDKKPAQKPGPMDFYKDRAIKEGMQIKETKLANGEIELHLLN